MGLPVEGFFLSHVVKLTTIRFVLSIVVAEDLHLEQLDIKTVFLHGDLEDDIYDIATGLYHVRKGAISLQAQEESLWLETGSETVVSEVQQIHY